MNLTREKIVLVGEQELERRLRACLERRELPDAFLYAGEAGSENWLKLDSGEEFPVASDLGKLLEGNKGTIARIIGNRNLASIGVGDGVKERVLMEAMGGVGHYCCVDVSEKFVELAMREAETVAEGITGVVSLMEDAERVQGHWKRPTAICLLGNNFCNYEPNWLLGRMRGVLGEDGLLVFDGSLLPSETEAVERVYNSQANRLFNAWPLLERGLAADGYDFELRLIKTDDDAGGHWRTQKRIRIKRESAIRVDHSSVVFGAGETIEMGFTYKYGEGEVHDILERNGFGVLSEIYDEGRANMIVVAKA